MRRAATYQNGGWNVDHNDTLTQGEWTRRAYAAILVAQLFEDPQASRPRNNGTDPRKIFADAIRTLEQMDGEARLEKE